MQTLWFILVGFMITMYVVLDGFDLGAGVIHLFAAKNDEERRLILRAIGPSLSSNGVSGSLADPTLTLYNSAGGVLASNDNWRDTQQADIEATGVPPTDDREAAIVANLPPGPYTAVLAGRDGGTGIGVVEVFCLGL